MTRARLAFGLAASAFAAAAFGQGPTFSYAPDPTPPALAGQDAEVVRLNCSACHSLDYIATQPRGKGAAFWRAEVDKMVHAYGAPVTPEDADAVTAALARVYG